VTCGTASISGSCSDSNKFFGYQ